ncbi:cell division protein FtsZ [Chlamydiota bacterium]
MLRFDEKGQEHARIKVIGIGGGGSNIINHLNSLSFEDIRFTIINTDVQDLHKSSVKEKLQIGKSITHGLGTGGDADLGKQSAEVDAELLTEIVEDTDIVFLVTCLGGGTGTGALPVMTNICLELGILTIILVTKPFFFEGKKKNLCAQEGLKKILKQTVTVFTIPNDKLVDIANEETSFIDGIKIADNFLCETVKATSQLINRTGLINLDFADIKRIMEQKGKARIGFGQAEGTGKTLNAFESALTSPLLEEKGIFRARGILISITGGEDLTLLEINHAMRKIHENVHPDANILFGATIDADMHDRVSLTIIATGIEEESPREEEKNEVSSKKEEQTVLAFDRFDRGKFSKTEPTLQDGIDLDIPTFIRKKVKVLED